MKPAKHCVFHGRILSHTIMPRLNAALISIITPEKVTISGYYHFGAFRWPLPGPECPEFIGNPMNEPPAIGKVVTLLVEDEPNRRNRLAEMGTREGREKASDADVQLEKKMLVLALCHRWQWNKAWDDIQNRPVYRVCNLDASGDDHLFEGTMEQLVAKNDPTLWSYDLVTKEHFRGAWVICKGDPRDQYRKTEEEIILDFPLQATAA